MLEGTDVGAYVARKMTFGSAKSGSCFTLAKLKIFNPAATPAAFKFVVKASSLTDFFIFVLSHSIYVKLAVLFNPIDSNRADNSKVILV